MIPSEKGAPRWAGVAGRGLKRTIPSENDAAGASGGAMAEGHDFVRKGRAAAGGAAGLGSPALIPSYWAAAGERRVRGLTVIRISD